MAALAFLAGCAPAAPGGVVPARLWGFTGPWDPRSDSMLVQAAPRLAVAVTGWFALDSASALPLHPFRDTARVRHAARWALVTSWHGDRFHPGTVRTLAADTARLVAAGDSLTRLVRAGRYRGVVLDLEGHVPGEEPELRLVAAALATAARRGGAKAVALAVPADGGAYADSALLATADRALVMLYDQHWSGSAPGPVSSPDWADAALARWRAILPPERLVAALPVYGYVWRNAIPGAVLAYPELLALQREAGEGAERDDATDALVLRFGGGEAWFTDVQSLQRLRTVANRYGVGTVALWRLGLEDPRIWQP